VVQPGSTVLTGSDVAVKVMLTTAELNTKDKKRVTAAGPFTLQVTGTSGGISHTANIQGTLMVRSMRLRH
jgi:hypothetical protein